MKMSIRLIQQEPSNLFKKVNVKNEIKKFKFITDC